MITLYLRYTIDPNKLADFAKYAADEQIPIAQSGGRIRVLPAHRFRRGD